MTFALGTAEDPITPTVEVAALIRQHRLDPTVTHDDLQASTCRCGKVNVVAKPPVSTGDMCASCGGMTVRTGSCHTCTSCGTSGGCG